MTNQEPDYEIFVEYLGTDYRVEADLYDHGVYDIIPVRNDDPGGFDILEDPIFCGFKIVDVETDLEIIPEQEKEVLYIATEVLKNLYWDEWLNY